MRLINIRVGHSDSMEVSLDSLRERQLARGLLPEEVNFFLARKGQVPLCDAEVLVSNEGIKFKCGLYGPLPTREFQQVCLRCQEEISATLAEEERLYHKVISTTIRR